MTEFTFSDQERNSALGEEFLRLRAYVTRLEEERTHQERLAKRFKASLEEMDARIVHLHRAIANACDIPIEFDYEATMAVALLEKDRDKEKNWHAYWKKKAQEFCPHHEAHPELMCPECGKMDPLNP